jgi:hypothetical protein
MNTILHASQAHLSIMNLAKFATIRAINWRGMRYIKLIYYITSKPATNLLKIVQFKWQCLLYVGGLNECAAIEIVL